MKVEQILFEEPVAGGAPWSHVLKRGTALRLIDIEGGANAGVMLHNADCPAERYNMPDTLKAQHIARLTAGCALYSDMGRVLCSITADSVGWHDPIGGCGNAAAAREKYGGGSYQELRNDCVKSAFDLFLIELAKYGLDARDLVAPINFFSRVVVGDDGGMRFVEGNSPSGSFVEIRAEMNVLVVLNTCPHPMDPRPDWAPKPVRLEVRRTPAPGPDDPCRISRPENQRGFTLTERYFL
ncbi:MAG: urea carboxylase-associated family protein [Bryobacteraceae bacterium]